MVKKIFIIDDEPINTFIVKQMAIKVNMAEQYIIFNDSKTALETLLQLPDSEMPEIIFVDINMPALDGWDIVTNLTENRPHLNLFIVFLTSSIADEDRLKAAANPSIKSYLIKPINPADLQTVLQTYESSRRN
jgi:CheY-like chemotaxis protein